MKYALDFTWDPVTYAGLPEFVDDIRAKGMRYIIILVSMQNLKSGLDEQVLITLD